MTVLGYHVLDASSAQWLSDDERTWGDYEDAACFATWEAAARIAQRECGDRIIAIMADCGSPS